MTARAIGQPAQVLTIPTRVPAERAVLGACLASPIALAEVSSLLKITDFYSDSNRVVWSAMQRLSDRGSGIDPMLVHAELEAMGQSAVAGGLGYVLGLCEGLPDVGNVGHYGSLVRGASQRRVLVQLGQEMIAGAVDEANHPDDVAADASRRLVEMGGSQREVVSLVGELAADEQRRLMREAEGHGRAWVYTGYQGLDGVLSGLRPGDMVVLAARPKVGKTAMALNIAMHVARVQRKQVLFCSKEMKAAALTQRLVSSLSSVPLRHIRDGRLMGGTAAGWGGEWDDVDRAVKTVRDVPLRIRDVGVSTPGEIRRQARAQKLREGLDLVVVDYLQKLNADQSKGKRYEIVTEISGALKDLAMELDVPVLVLSQLNRDAAKEKRRPDMSELRESGAIEQDADTVLLIHRRVLSSEEWKDRKAAAAVDTATAEVIVAAQRQGPTQVLPFSFHGPTTTYHEMYEGGGEEIE